MLDVLLLNAATCVNGTCPQAVVTTSYVLAPQVVAAAPLIPGKTKVITKYKRGLFGRLVPDYAEVTTVVSEAKSSSGSCKGGCK